MIAGRTGAARFEIVIAGLALGLLLLAQALAAGRIPGTNYYGGDGKMVQAVVLSTYKFGQPFDVTGLSAVQAMGSQVLPKNVWANPSLWPFALLDREAAPDVSAVIALGIFALCCYLMCRCFDLAVVPSAIAAQLCIALFAPAVFVIHTPTNFCLSPVDAVVYAPYLIAFGLVARLRPGSRPALAPTALSVSALILYSVYADPLFTMIPAVTWVLPFLVVVFWPFEKKAMVLRMAALACMLAVLVLSGIAEYLYTLSQYTARVQFPAVFDRPREAIYVSAMTYSPNMKYIYLACFAGWFLGMRTLEGRPRVLVASGLAAFAGFAVYSVVYLLLLNAVWVPPIPIYLEHCLLPLYAAGMVAGVCGGLRWLASQSAGSPPRWLQSERVSLAAVLAAVAFLPAWVVKYSLTDAKMMPSLYLPWPNQPELMDLLARNVSQAPGQPFKGSVNFVPYAEDYDEVLDDAWARGFATVNEYSQLVTPPSMYFVHKLLDRDVRHQLNRYDFFWSNGKYSPQYWKAQQSLGVRYVVFRRQLPGEFTSGLPPPIRFPYRKTRVGSEQTGDWYVYELPHPNLGNYSPTEVVVRPKAAEVMATLGEKDFDSTRQVVLPEAIDKPLAVARDMTFSRIRGGIHVSGKSDGTSLVVLPQQYSHCLRARGKDVRVVRANLMMAAIVFTGTLDTDIEFEYGLLSPSCRRQDIADVKTMAMRIDLRQPHLAGDRLFPDHRTARAKLRAAFAAFQ